MIRHFLLLSLLLAATAGCASEASSEASPAPAPADEAAASTGSADTFDEGMERVGPPEAHIALTESGTSVSVEECREGCRTHADCVSWSWKRSLINEGVGLCTFSKVEGEQTPDERSISGVIANE